MRFLLGLALALMVTTAQAQTAPRITVTGEATVSAAPDMATVSLGVTTQDSSATGAMKSNAAALTAVLARLEAAGIATRDLQTSNLQLGPNWTQTDGSTAPQIAGYTASNMLSVRVRDLTILGAVLDAVITDGANTLNGISFEQSDPKPLADSARAAAVADAMAKAQLLTKAAGMTLGQVIEMSEIGGYGVPMPMMKAVAMDSEAMPVAAGEVGVTASVTMVFAVNP